MSEELDPTTLPGADIVLRMVYLRTQHPDLFDTEEDGDTALVTYRVTTYAGYNEETGKHSWDGPPRWVVYLDCSDCFFWGSADAEELTAENFPILEKTIADVGALYAEWRARSKAQYEVLHKEQEAAYSAYRTEHPDKSDRRAYDEFGNPRGTEFQYTAPKAPKNSVDHYRLASPLCQLFAARVRNERPQGASYSYFPAELWHFFDECGPQRAIEFGNPREPGTYKGPWSEHKEKWFAEQHA